MIHELLIQFVVIALGALFGSTIMWILLGPLIAQKGMGRFTQEAWDLTDEEVSDPKRMMKAITKKQGETFAKAVYGAFGSIVKDAPTEELAALAGQVGPGLIDAAAPLLQGNSSPQGGIAQLAPLLQQFQGDGKGKGSSWTKMIEMMMMMSSLSQMGGNGAGPGAPAMIGGGGSSGPVSGW